MKHRMSIFVVTVAIGMGILFLTTASRAQVRMSSPAVFPWFRADQVDITYDEKGNERIVGQQTVEQHHNGTLTIISPVGWLGNLLHTRRVINTNGIAESFLGPIPVSLSSGASEESGRPYSEHWLRSREIVSSTRRRNASLRKLHSMDW